MVRGWEVEVAGRAAKVQDGAAGSGEGVKGGREGRAELLRVVPRVVLRDDLLQAKGQGTGAGSGASHLPEPSRRGEGWTELWGQNPGAWSLAPRGLRACPHSLNALKCMGWEHWPKSQSGPPGGSGSPDQRV